MKYAINPGTGPTPDGTKEQSEINIQQFIKDTGAKDVEYRFLHSKENGRHVYKIWDKDKANIHDIEMPAIPLEQVRYMGPGQDIWQFPRLYVDGSSWVWLYAIDACFNSQPQDTNEVMFNDLLTATIRTNLNGEDQAFHAATIIIGDKEFRISPTVEGNISINKANHKTFKDGITIRPEASNKIVIQ